MTIARKITFDIDFLKYSNYRDDTCHDRKCTALCCMRTMLVTVPVNCVSIKICLICQFLKLNNSGTNKDLLNGVKTVKSKQT